MARLPPRIALPTTSLSRHIHRHLLVPTGPCWHHPQSRLEHAFSFPTPPFRLSTTPGPPPPPLTPLCHTAGAVWGNGAPPAARGRVDRFGTTPAVSTLARRCRLAEPGHAGLVGPGPGGTRGVGDCRPRSRGPLSRRSHPTALLQPAVTARRASAGVRAAGGARRQVARAGPAPSCHGPYPARRGCCPGTGPVFLFFFFGGRSSCLDVGAQGGEGEGGWGETGSEASGLCARRCCTAHHPPPSPFWHFSHAVRGSPLPSTAPLPSPPPSLWAPTRATALGRIVGRCWPRRPVGGATRR